MTTKGHILVVEPDATLQQAFQAWFAPRGYPVVIVGGMGQARTRVAEGLFSLVVLSVSLPDGDGLVLCREIRERLSLPILVLGERDAPDDELAAFEAGADRYLARPLTQELTVARARSLIRRQCAEQQRDLLDIGDLLIDRTRLQAYHQYRSLGLSPTEFRLLNQLSLVPGAPLSRATLIAEVWGTGYTDTPRLVDAHVRNLRQKLRASRCSLSIYGVRGFGYRLELVRPLTSAAVEPTGVLRPGQPAGQAHAFS